MSHTGAPQYPRRPEDVDAAAMTAILSKRYPGLRVTHCQQLRIILGTATKMQLRLHYNDIGQLQGLPETLWLKAGLEVHSEQTRSLYALESAFYRDLAPFFAGTVPKSYFSDVDKSGQAVLLLEDLQQRNLRFSSALNPLSVQQAKNVLDVLARIHGRYWDGSELAQYPWLPAGSSLRDSGAIHFIVDKPNWTRMMALPRNQGLPAELRDRERIATSMMALLEVLAERTHCLIHGDAHSGNLGFDRQAQPVLYDWQTVMRGYWVHDVAHFMVSALNIETRRRAEQALLKHYLQSLAREGVEPPAWEAAWLAYRRHLLYSYSWMLCPPQWQSDDICAVCAERAQAALADHHTLALWG